MLKINNLTLSSLQGAFAVAAHTSYYNKRKKLAFSVKWQYFF